MRLTIRGWTALAIVGLSVVLGWEYGARALNAVVTPLVVVLAAGVVTTVAASRPEIRRAPIAEGFVGDRRTVEISITTRSSVSATVRDTAGDGYSIVAIEAAGDTDIDGDNRPGATTTLEGEDRFSYEIRLEERGEHEIGPLTVTITDVFGLVKRRFTDDETQRVLVYPPVHDLRAGPGRELETFVTDTQQDREEFDHLREYQRGDSLRDIHWKSAAKRADSELVVTEYAANEETGSATVAAECVPGYDDDLATAVASVTSHLLEADIDVGVSVPDGECPPGAGEEHRRDLLAAFAVLEAGELEDRDRRAADVLVQADTNSTRVVLDGRTIPFERLVGPESEVAE